MVSPHAAPAPAFRVVTQIALSPATLAVLDASGFGPFQVHVCSDRAAVLAQLAGGGDAVILRDGPHAAALADEIAPSCALVIAAGGLRAPDVLAWLSAGAQDVLHPDELDAATLPQRLRAAIERKRIERGSRMSYATDLDTGLPHQQQLIEHMSQLLALREREPAPMAVLALRVEGLASAQARFGSDAAHAVRRKIGVRLRAGVRASDVVAAIGNELFAVLLVSILAPTDAERVGAKLVRAITEPLPVAGSEVALAAALGIGQFPADGTQPDALLRRAVGLATSAPALGRAGFANFGEAGPADAANDA